MPRAPSKRAASGAASESQPKRTKTSSAATSAAAATDAAAAAVAAAPKSKRWSAVSASRNADDDFKLAVRDPERANAFMCICPPPFIVDDDEDEEDDDEDDDEDEDDENEDDQPKKSKKDKPKCDGGKTCLCNKPAAEHPDHHWILTYGGFRKWIAQLTMAGVRDPDCFSMYTFNDHANYGILEVLQNLMLDWVEAPTWQEQWIVCEGLVLFALGDGQRFYMIDDGDQADVVAELIGRLFLTVLSRLEAKHLLAEGSEVKNLGLVMALYIKLASELRGGSLLEGEGEETNQRPSRFTWVPSRFDDYINAFAIKHGITLRGLDDIDDLTAELDTDVPLPAGGETAWGWASAFKSYTKEYASAAPMGGGTAKIGGDNLDITAWSSAERKRYSFNKKDPLSKKDLEELKEGMVMQMM